MDLDRKFNAQAAMEYLITYSWAIIIIVIVAVILLNSGIFRILLAQPRGQPQACTVSRPDGPGSDIFISTAGICNELPEYVDQFRYVSSSLLASGTANLTITKLKYMPAIGAGSNGNLTITGWILTEPQGQWQTAFAYGQNIALPNEQVLVVNTNSSPYCNDGIFISVFDPGVAATSCAYNSAVPINKWIFVAVTANSVYLTGYTIISGNVISLSSPISPSWVVQKGQGEFQISVPWNGLISNIQFYNTTLSYNSIVGQYNEGLGGAPINLKNLVGWWPLNGNDNDYSGNNNNAATSNTAGIGVGGSWINNYLSP